MAYAFGPFVLIPGQQRLLHDGAAVRIRGRALDILALLVARPGDVVEKSELIAGAWPNIFVDESNLKVNVAALRRVLGDGREDARYIATVSGRGYRFVAPVRLLTQVDGADAPATGAGAPQLVAQSGQRLIGRAGAVAGLQDAFDQGQLLTIVGTGGIGKTSVALAVAAESAHRFKDGAVLVDLSPVPEARFIPAALASALGLPIHTEQVLPTLIAYLQGRNVLIVLDSCEHLIDAVAILAEEIVAGTTAVCILATSREPLSISHEQVYRLPALDTPPDPVALSAHEAMTYSAVQLFVERARARSAGFALTDANASVVAAICQRLDGLALAIELAATRVDMFSLPDLLGLLNDRFRLLSQARRSRFPRQRSLSATLDWSYDLLPEEERRSLRGLSVFAGPFTLDSAATILAQTGETFADMSAIISSLVAKSLVQSDVSGPATLYRLLDTTRIYARSHLLASGEAGPMMRRHAAHFRQLAERSEADWETLPASDWLARYGRVIDDVRSALAWAFSDSGDAEIGVALTVAAIPLWEHLSLIDECRSFVERALGNAALERGSDSHIAMKLLAALGTSLLHTRGPLPGGKAAWSEAHDIARHLGDYEYQLRALWGLCDYATWSGDHRAALATVGQLREIATRRNDAQALVNVDRQAGTALRYLGQQAEARTSLERMIASYTPPLYRAEVARFQFDPRVGARGTLANVLWLQGFPAQASAMAMRALQEAEEAGHAMALCNALAHTATPVALYAGDMDRARELLARLEDHVARHPMGIWQAVARALRGALLVGRGQPAGVQVMIEAIENMRDAGFQLRHAAYLGVLAVGLTQTGEERHARRAIEEALDWARRSGELWCYAELLRIDGELCHREGFAQAAENRFQRALRWARRQGARSFELRAATSLASLHRELGLGDAAETRLAQLIDRFEEGWDTADLRAARAPANDSGLAAILA